jgi:hypothetical protein
VSCGFSTYSFCSHTFDTGIDDACSVDPRIGCGGLCFGSFGNAMICGTLEL